MFVRWSFVASLIVPCVAGRWSYAQNATSAPDTAAGVSDAGESREIPDIATKLEFSVTPGVWLPRVEANTSLGGSSFAVETTLDMDDIDAVFTGEFMVRKAEVWELTFSAFDFETDSTGRTNRAVRFGRVMLPRGARQRSSLEMTSVAADLTIGSLRPFADGQRTAAGDLVVDFRLAPRFGFRYLDIDQRVEAVGGLSQSTSGEWAAVTVGAMLELQYRPEDVLPWINMIELEVSAGVGPAFGGDGGSVWDVRGNLIVHVCDSVGVMVGFRGMEVDVEGNDGFEFDGGLQGLFVGVSIRF